MTHPRQKLRYLRVRTRVLSRNVIVNRTRAVGVTVEEGLIFLLLVIQHVMKGRILGLRHRSRVLNVFLYSVFREGDEEGTLKNGSTQRTETERRTESEPTIIGVQTICSAGGPIKHRFWTGRKPERDPRQGTLFLGLAS